MFDFHSGPPSRPRNWPAGYSSTPKKGFKPYYGSECPSIGEILSIKVGNFSSDYTRVFFGRLNLFREKDSADMTTLESVITGNAPLSRYSIWPYLRRAQRPRGARFPSRHSRRRKDSPDFTVKTKTDPGAGSWSIDELGAARLVFP